MNINKNYLSINLTRIIEKRIFIKNIKNSDLLIFTLLSQQIVEGNDHNIIVAIGSTHIT